MTPPISINTSVTGASAIALLSIEKAVTEALSNGPEPVIDVFAETADKGLSLVP